MHSSNESTPSTTTTPTTSPSNSVSTKKGGIDPGWSCAVCACPPHWTPMLRPHAMYGPKSICNACYIRVKVSADRSRRGSARPASLAVAAASESAKAILSPTIKTVSYSSAPPSPSRRVPPSFQPQQQPNFPPQQQGTLFNVQHPYAAMQRMMEVTAVTQYVHPSSPLGSTGTITSPFPETDQNSTPIIAPHFLTSPPTNSWLDLIETPVEKSLELSPDEWEHSKNSSSALLGVKRKAEEEEERNMPRGRTAKRAARFGDQ